MSNPRLNKDSSLPVDTQKQTNQSNSDSTSHQAYHAFHSSPTSRLTDVLILRFSDQSTKERDSEKIPVPIVILSTTENSRDKNTGIPSLFLLNQFKSVVGWQPKHLGGVSFHKRVLAGVQWDQRAELRWKQPAKANNLLIKSPLQDNRQPLAWP